MLFDFDVIEIRVRLNLKLIVERVGNAMN